MVTDDVNTYKPAVERLGIERQICAAHVKKRAWNRLDRIEGRDWTKARICPLLTELPFDGDVELLRLERMVRDGDATLRRLCVELSEKWRALLCRRRRDVPWTNSAAERGIGRSEIRRKTARGYKSEDGMMDGLGLRRWAWSGRDGLDMSEMVVALRRAVRCGICALRNPPKDDQPFMGRLRDSPAPDKRRLGNVHCRAGDCHA